MMGSFHRYTNQTRKKFHERSELRGEGLGAGYAGLGAGVGGDGSGREARDG